MNNINIKIEEFERKALTLNQSELIYYLQERRIFPRELSCSECQNPLSINKYKKNIDGFAWRCATRQCSKFKQYFSLRKNTFLEGMRLDIRTVLRIIAKYGAGCSRISIQRSLNICKTTVLNVVKKIIRKIPPTDFKNDKLGGGDKIVQIDETMLNFKCKSHRGRSTTNKTDALCIVEYDGEITRVFATTIIDKKARTILPHIKQQVVSGSTIYTDEAKVYKSLCDEGYSHGSVCHKYKFVDYETGVHTQAVESFNNQVKRHIKWRMGVQTELRQDFLKEFAFYYNNRKNYFVALLEALRFE